MKIDIYSIAKKERSTYDPIYKDYHKMISKFSSLDDIEIFNKDVTKAHALSREASQAVYSKILKPNLNKGYSIVLHPKGKKVDSFEFSKLLSDKISIQFYIGGAYGFEDDFVKSCDKAISLGDLTLSHKNAKLILLEQIYRGFTILNNHPYHK